LTVCLVVLGKHFQSLTFLDILLGDDPVLAPDVLFYQRLLARDQDEASEIARERIQNEPLARVFDEIFIPALIAARSDFESGLLSESEAAAIFEIVREVVEEVGAAPSAAGNQTEEATAGQPKLKILTCAARDAADETAIEMFLRVLDPKTSMPEMISTDHLVSEIVSLVADQHTAIVCIASLPPGGLAHTRLLCKRLRASFPDLKIIVGRWGLKPDAEKRNREQLLEAGADLFGTSLEETALQLAQLEQLIHSMVTSTKPPSTIAAAAPLVASQTSA